MQCYFSYQGSLFVGGIGVYTRSWGVCQRAFIGRFTEVGKLHIVVRDIELQDRDQNSRVIHTCVCQ